jgi:hypothetical protein
MWKGYQDARFHAPASYRTVTAEERRGLLRAVNDIKTGYGLEQREVHCLAASAHVLVSDLRPSLERVFGRLPEVEDSTFLQDLDSCLSNGDRRT